MKTIHVDLKKTIDTSYDIIIGNNILENVVQEIHSTMKSSTYIIITDSNIDPLYGEDLYQLFVKNNISCIKKVVNAGESSKCRETKAQIEDWMLEDKCDRKSCVISLGGGVIGDLSGFVASTYLRGIPFIQIPTSLLAMVDASIGGKTAINVTAGKNLIGTFHQPKQVYVDLNLLQSLPERQIKTGFAEVIKMAIIQDKKLFDFLLENTTALLNKKTEALTYVIAHNAQSKAFITTQDEKESGIRAILNFGHTIGHAIESLMQFELTHGEAISIGMAYEAKLSAKLGFLSEKDAENIITCLDNFGLPTKIPSELSIENIIEKTSLDKKASDKKARYILINEIGSVQKSKDTFTHIVSENIVSKILQS